MTVPIRFGILGCARICRRGMIPGILQSGVATIDAIASRQRETGDAWAKEFSIAKSYSSYDNVIADPDIDAIYIPLPNELHLEWTLKAAAAGKHVLCEKPLALDMAEAQKMADGCAKHGVILMEAFMYRHHPRITRALEMLAAGDLGELRLVKMDFSFQISNTDWRLDPARGGGPLFDLGCYGINAARLFTGSEPVDMQARGRIGKTGVEMTAGFQLHFKNDVIGLMDCSFECPDRNRIEIVGTQGVLELPGGVLPSTESALNFTTSAGTEMVRIAHADQYAEQVKTFVQSIAAQGLVYPAENGLANMRVLQQVTKLVRGS